MKFRTLLAASATVISLGFTASPAAAQATRTWVSGVGDDVNPCSRTAPCKTFAGAISKTAAGGEINCLDPGGFGAVTITKSLTISCPYTEGGALAGGNGITVNLPLTSDVVFIRGLDIFGVNPPSNGIRMIGVGTLHVEDSVIRRFNAASSAGISIAPTGTATVTITNTTVATNGNGATGGGVVIAPTGAGVVSVSIDDSRILGNANAGVIVSGASTVMITDSTVSHNPSFGIRTSTGSPTVRVGTTTITGNGTGVSVGAGTIESYCTNQLNGNSGDGAFFGACLPLK
ncbi:MAG: right-handed parallel beta-helix repeat-containing protein [Alphaproteobacteria bacterium]|nr:MAG: right-handed parallel beta-helix repeat-containing protein [Alphaproteobacteria bacterium]